ncbi:isocitrate/isopropylmalate dehydrogenase family protein [Jiangella anatolica]|uniref:Tartrate dehydrogenase n=1 Tax=Jiangella anatolica TaxID=2670374 RepID=A0A2W2BTW0_9ACTN|nr:isocitrate/isopropylmalate family dehydrogenase [Jiangella anatolica]PZF79539.1 tartrate dehydrogenase [Jiangella anatolica]
MTTSPRIAVIAGDGIGREVVPPVVELVDTLLRHDGVTARWTTLDWSTERYLATGEYIPPGGLELLAGHDAILLGAVGDPRVPDAVSLGDLLLRIRRHFDQFVNLRPLSSLPGVTMPLRDGAPFDLVVVRENTEGEYADIGGRVHAGRPQEVVVQTSVFTRAGVERLLRFSFQLAARRRGVVTSATKSNALRHSMVFWEEVAADVAKDFPGVEYRHVHIDALAAALVRDPSRFDVIASSNLFGDILADLGAVLMGSIGAAPSGNINPDRSQPSMFEPVHGSAPDIVGRGIASPVGQLLSAVLMLDHLGLADQARRLDGAVRAALASGDAVTPDLGGTADTGGACRAVARVLGAPVP